MVEAAGLVVDHAGSTRGRSRPSGCRRSFDYNVAPFFQSFVEVRVEPSANRVRVLPYGVHGRLTWGDMASSDTSIRRPDVTAETLVEWSVPMGTTCHSGRIGRAVALGRSEYFKQMFECCAALLTG